jgi:hypothetical protein
LQKYFYNIGKNNHLYSTAIIDAIIKIIKEAEGVFGDVFVNQKGVNKEIYNIKLLMMTIPVVFKRSVVQERKK